ncbi:hypothetical protein LO763_11680 [Glycomyces sp. A-F 0318]|uniref:hypothetical protein n=1 Tax=Glycomyces amatae TaxID=2881355 RepID=UPI001E47967B|nr:hypothetical protein [Glycomyces amatae]MCD0444282.1 hypothetical protein [Glycomyces amatae]
MLDLNVHEQINTGLRQALADCMPTGSGGIIAVRGLPEKYEIAPMADLTATYGEHRMTGLGVAAALGALAVEIRSSASVPEPHLIGIGLIAHAPVGTIGTVAILLAVVDGHVHQITWPHEQGTPVWEIKPTENVDDADCAAYAAAAHDLLTALTGANDEGGAR